MEVEPESDVNTGLLSADSSEAKVNMILLEVTLDEAFFILTLNSKGWPA